MSEPTARPWHIGFPDESGKEDGMLWIVSRNDAAGRNVSVVSGGDNFGARCGVHRAEDAALIVKAVNSHDRLVEVLEELLKYVNTQGMSRERVIATGDIEADARAALEKAKR